MFLRLFKGHWFWWNTSKTTQRSHWCHCTFTLLVVQLISQLWYHTKRLANIVPVLKKVYFQKVENYPLIPLLLRVSKVLERCILNIIKTHLCNQVSKHQNGFLKGKSCTTNLIETLDCIGRLLDRWSQIEVIYVMSKAFDKVNHAQLLSKLHIFGFGGKLFNLDLNNVRSWSTKSHCQSITRKTKPPNTAYDMNEAMLEKTSHECDLDVWVSTDPIWNQSNARCMQTSCMGLLNDLRVIYKVPM